MRKLSTYLSVALHPIFIPTYMMLLYMLCVPLCYYGSKQLFWGFLLLTAITTILMPLSIFKILINKGKLSGLKMHDRRERLIPYIVSTICMLIWSTIVLKIFRNPQLSLMAFGGTIGLLLTTLINTRWKISAHMLGMGSLIGAVVGTAWYIADVQMLYISLPILTALTILLMIARLYLNEHTPLQVITGFILGVCATAMPIVLIY